jgi:hypothetical protein
VFFVSPQFHLEEPVEQPYARQGEAKQPDFPHERGKENERFALS